MAHGTHGGLLGFALSNALLDDGGIVLLQVLAMDLLESLGGQVWSETSLERWGVIHGKKGNDIMEPRWWYSC